MTASSRTPRTWCGRRNSCNSSSWTWSSPRRNTAPVNRRYVLVLSSLYRHLPGEISHLSTGGTYSSYHLSIVISQEKHGTCQQEVRTHPSISLSSYHTSNFAPATLYCPAGQFVPVQWSVWVCVAGEQPRPGDPEAASGAGHESAEVHWSPGGG